MVNTNGGAYSVIDTYEMKVLKKEKKHNLPVTSSAFIEDKIGNIRGLFTASADYSYNFSPAYTGPGLVMTMAWSLVKIIMMALVLGFLIETYM
jgi:hypothetical protein